MKCPHFTTDTCTVCRDLDQAVELLGEAKEELIRHAGTAMIPPVENIERFVKRVEREHP